MSQCDQCLSPWFVTPRLRNNCRACWPNSSHHLLNTTFSPFKLVDIRYRTLWFANVLSQCLPHTNTECIWDSIIFLHPHFEMKQHWSLQNQSEYRSTKHIKLLIFKQLVRRDSALLFPKSCRPNRRMFTSSCWAALREEKWLCFCVESRFKMGKSTTIQIFGGHTITKRHLKVQFVVLGKKF